MREVKESSYLYESIEDVTMKNRAKNSLNWFIRKAVVYKRCYYTFASTSIITPLTLTILNSVDATTFLNNQFKELSVLLATLATVSSSFLALFRFKDQWQEYRSTAEIIKAELVRFQMKSGEYKDQDISILCNKMETIIAQSNAKQRKIIESENEVDEKAN